MRKLVLSALFLSAFPLLSIGQVIEGQWTYIVENGGATITASTATGAVTIPSELGGYAVKKLGNGSPIFGNGNTSVTSVVIPSSVTRIGESSFSNCTSLASITIPNSVTSIGRVAFYRCLGLATFTFEPTSSLTSIGEFAFQTCVNLASISIPSSVTSIGAEAFAECASLASVTFEPTSKVPKIDDNVFYGCRSLTSIILPSSVATIGYQAFKDCRGLASITIPNSVTSIGEFAFGDCFSLVNVYLPARFADTYTNFGLTASQANFGITLTASCNSSEGTILVNPNKIPYEAGESVVVTATPKAGYLFGNWSGASTATTSSITLTMDARKSLTAIFIQDGRDTDGDSLTNYQESITYGTNPNQKDSNLDGVEDGHAVSMGYNPTQNFSALVAHPPTGLYTANQMQAMAMGDLVLTKNANGSFTLNYDIEQSTDLQTWTTYAPLSLPLTNLPTNKAFVRIKAKQ